MVDFDSLLSYETIKVVRIKSKILGGIYYSLIFLVLCYVVGYQILYRNEHFQRFPVQGMGRMSIQQPTLNMCNPNDHDCVSDYKPLTDLPYCKAYTGKHPSRRQEQCVYKDQHSLVPHGMLDEKMMIPTRIDQHVETRDCVPSAENGWQCRNEYTPAHANANSTENVYIADIERYTMLFSHTYYRGLVRGNSLSTPGFYRTCPQAKKEEDDAASGLDGTLDDTAVLLNGATECPRGWKYKSIDCVNDACQFVSGYQQKDCNDEAKTFLQAWKGAPSRAPSNGTGFAAAPVRRGGLVLAQEPEEPVKPGRSAAAEKGVVAIPPGDVFPLKDLLKIAGVHLDGGDHSGQYTMDCEPYREAGVLLEVEAYYTNLEPWMSSFRDNSEHISYTYNIRTRPVGEVKSEQFASMQPLDFPATRLIENRHGVLLVLKVSGEFGEFSIVYLLVMLTTSLALLAVATKAVDFLAIYVLAEKEMYAKMKYEDHKDESRGGPLIAGL